MKNYGKVTRYNGTHGNIKGIDGIDYVLLKKNVVGEEIKETDNVEFEPEFLKTFECDIYMARFVKVLHK